MAGFHISLTCRTATGDRSGRDRAQYILREGLYRPQDVAYLLRTSAAHRDRRDLRHVETGNLPPWCAEDPAAFFAAASLHEGANRYYAVAMRFSLPRELTHEQHLALARDMVAALVPDKPYLWVKHESRADDGGLHPHIHVLFSARAVDGIARGPAQMFRRWNREQPEHGGAKKDLFWSKRQAVMATRYAFADLSNFHLERAGVATRVDIRKLRQRDIDRPTQHRGSPPLDAATLAQEQQQAAAAWEQRKAYKGLGEVHTIPREEFVLLVRQWTRDYVPGQALSRSSPAVVTAYHAREWARLAHEARTIEHGIRGLHAHVKALNTELTLAQLQAKRGQPTHATAVARQDALLARGIALGLEPPSGGGRRRGQAEDETEERPARRRGRDDGLSQRPPPDKEQGYGW